MAGADKYITVSEPTHDFGKIVQGKPVKTSFYIVNHGTTPMIVNSITASCGCTSPEWEQGKPIAPNDTLHFKVGYNAAVIGSFNKSITVSYNDKQENLYIIGEVVALPVQQAPKNSQLRYLD